MQTPNNLAGTITEMVMTNIGASSVLKDGAGVYNRAYSAVYEALKLGLTVVEETTPIAGDTHKALMRHMLKKDPHVTPPKGGFLPGPDGPVDSGINPYDGVAIPLSRPNKKYPSK